MRLENGNYVCGRCKKEIKWEDLMLIGCRFCGGDNGSASYGIHEAKFNRGRRRLNGIIS